MRIGIVGAGWAGLAAAIHCVRAGHAVTLFEAARTLGGRARAISSAAAMPGYSLDNGQHILIGAYTECLALMAQVGVDAHKAFVRSPMALIYPDGTGIRLANTAPPWDALWGIMTAKGWSAADKWALLMRASQWQRQRFQCDRTWTVAQLCEGLPQHLMATFIEPLCVSALNTPCHQASAAVFLRVLQDSLFSGRGGSHLLLPRTDLGALFPQAAHRWLTQQGAQVVQGHRVNTLTRLPTGWLVDQQEFDRVVLATPSTESARLVQAALPSLPMQERAAASAWANTAQALTFTAIATVYAKAKPLPTGTVLPSPMLALWQRPHEPAQFVFDRGQLGGPEGLLAFVVSASEGDRQSLETAVMQQAHNQLGLRDLHVVQTVVEKRATFACTPDVCRPRAAIAPNLMACGDYVDGPYPATLEGAVRSATVGVALALDVTA